MNDIIFASDIFKFIIYADDTTLFSTLKDFGSPNSLNENINNEVTKITDWLKAKKLSLNIKKTKFMLFYMPPKKVEIPVLKIGGLTIDCVDSFNFLGITINKHLNWEPHINIIANKISRPIGILNKLKHFLPQNILCTVYNSLILCHLNYGKLVWGHTGIRLFKLQKKAMRIISLSKYNSYTETIFKKLKMLKLEDIYKLQQLKFYHKLINKT
jgi:hypothetical protein